MSILALSSNKSIASATMLFFCLVQSKIISIFSSFPYLFQRLFVIPVTTSHGRVSDDLPIYQFGSLISSLKKTDLFLRNMFLQILVQSLISHGRVSGDFPVYMWRWIPYLTLLVDPQCDHLEFRVV